MTPVLGGLLLLAALIAACGPQRNARGKLVAPLGPPSETPPAREEPAMVDSTGTPTPAVVIETPPPAAPTATVPEADKTRLSGRVMKVGGAPLPDVCIIVGPATLRCAAMTDAEGKFSLDLPRDYAVNWTLRYLVNGHEKFREALVGPFTDAWLDLKPITVEP